MRLIKLFTIAILVLSITLRTSGDLPCFQNNPYCHFNSQNGQITCAGTDDLSKINLACSDLNNQKIGMVFIIPSKNIILDSQLDLSKINYGLQRLVITNLDGFELVDNPLLKINFKNSDFFFFI